MNKDHGKLRHRPIVVGLALDESDSSHLSCALALARKLESPLELVHAMQPIFNYIGAGDVIVNPYYGYDRVLDEEEEQQAMHRLEAIKRNLAADGPVGLHLVRDYAAEALMAIAEQLQAGLIICGIGKDASTHILEGVSTAFSLAAHAAVPVLILPQAVRASCLDRPRILLADNLQDEGLKALAMAVCWAEELDASELCHVHVHPLARADVRHMVDRVREAMNLGKIPPNPDFSGPTYLEQMQHLLSAELKARFEKCAGPIRPSWYEPRVAYGKPSMELHRLTKEHQTQILVFGRHHLFHRQSFAIGKIPYKAMLEDDVASLIIPDLEPKTEQLTKLR